MNQNYAGFWIRFAAWIIDAIIVGLVNGFANFILRTFLGFYPLETYGLSLLIAIGYWVFYQSWAGQTLGKKALGLKVVDQNGKTPTQTTFFIREIVGKFVSGIILGIGYLMIIWDSKKQALHDKIASTFVIKVKG